MDIKIDSKICKAEYGEYLLQVAGRNNIYIPTLCHSDALPGQASCRICIVEVIENGSSKVVTSCVFPITKEIEVITNSEKINRMRRTLLMLLSMRVSNNEALNRLMVEYSVPAINRFTLDMNEKCILCGLCVKACEEVGQYAISTVSRGITKKVSTPYQEPSISCIGCGACASVCPTGAIDILEEGSKRLIWNKTFELMQCTRCGEYFATKEQLDYINERLGYETEVLLCEKCKKNAVSESLKNIVQNL